MPDNLAKDTRRLALDHLTVVDTDPLELAKVAAEAGCTAICPFLHSMDVLPDMPRYDLVTDAGLRAEFKAQTAAFDLQVDVAYPFTLAKHTILSDLAPVLDTAAGVGAFSVNALLYERDPAPRADKFAQFCDEA